MLMVAGTFGGVVETRYFRREDEIGCRLCATVDVSKMEWWVSERPNLSLKS
jgi:hypothetical protein